MAHSQKSKDRLVKWARDLRRIIRLVKQNVSPPPEHPLFDPEIEREFGDKG